MAEPMTRGSVTKGSAQNNSGPLPAMLLKSDLAVPRGQEEAMSMSSMQTDAQELATEVVEQMAILMSMKEDLDPERVASLLSLPVP